MKVGDLNAQLGTPARLAIVATVADGNPWVFSALKKETGLADGNLHVQTRKLTEAGILDAEKVRRGNRQVTRFLITEKGRRVFAEHIRQLQGAQGRSAGTEASLTGGRKSGPGNDDGSRVW